jgi:hypothetical protein
LKGFCCGISLMNIITLVRLTCVLFCLSRTPILPYCSIVLSVFCYAIFTHRYNVFQYY